MYPVFLMPTDGKLLGKVIGVSAAGIRLL